MAKNSGPNPRSFPKNNYLLPPWRAPKHFFTPFFRVHTFTTGSGDRDYGYFLRDFHVLIEIYPLVPFSSSVCEGMSDVTADVLRWGPVTSARDLGDTFFALDTPVSPRRTHPDTCVSS